MKKILKIIFFPIFIILNILKYVLLFILNVGTRILSLISVLIAVGAVASFINGEMELGITAIILALLFSPYGLPLIASKVIIGIEAVNLKIKNI
ncbi:CD1845 family protein [Facklamia sp. P12945]|uniref:CD1845 family protein n=1 Tax=Facklamia sp. P12945 TaxID=3421950 RepID=UPI003D168F31